MSHKTIATERCPSGSYTITQATSCSDGSNWTKCF